MNWMILIDGPSAAIVVGGTLFATLQRCGLRDCGAALRQLGGLAQPRFAAEATQAELSRQVREIRTDGLLRAPAHDYADVEFAEATGALLERRSLGAVIEKHEAHRAKRLAASARGIKVWAQAAELAPVFGMAGTLISLSQLPAEGVARGAFTGAIAMAVVTTLYGLLLGNLIFAPLARMIERAALAEEAERQRLIDWLTAQLSPDLKPRPLERAA
jgi:chemotaxis protein MotA